MIFCKNCGKQVKVYSKADMDIYLWKHLKEAHPKIFSAQSDKELEWIFNENFTTDNVESSLRIKTETPEYNEYVI